MSWQHDLELEQELRHRRIRGRILRTAVLWTPVFLAVLGLFFFFLYDQLTGGGRSTVFLLVVLALVSLLFGFQAIQAILDLRGKPKEIKGTVTRRWSRSDSFVFKTQYVRIGRTILRGDPDLLVEIRAGDEVEARFYPHTAIVVSIEKVKPEVAATPTSKGLKR